jgi:hypothetical protein
VLADRGGPAGERVHVARQGTVPRSMSAWIRVVMTS